MLDRFQVPLKVGHAFAVCNHAFPHAIDYFSSGKVSSWWRNHHTFPGITADTAIGRREFAIVDGNVSADLMVGKGSVVLVFGDVSASITLGDFSEVIVSGCICQGAHVSGHFQLFVGENVAGSLRTSGNSLVWVEGSFEGKLKSAPVHTMLWVSGDCTGEIIPAQRSIFSLVIGNYMPFANLEKIAVAGATLFRGSVGRSDRPAGLYPKRKSHNRLVGEAARSFLVVHEQLGGEMTDMTELSRPD
jgi:hypothetical protein